MATLITLAGQDGPLTHIEVPLGRREFQARWIYGLPDFMTFLTDDLPTLEPGRLKSAETPAEQMDSVLRKWITGATFRYDKMFKDLIPQRDEVWEMKTPDLRIFGWMYQPMRFIAVFGDYADLYKYPTQRRSYETARQRVVSARDRLELDEPKFTGGTFDALVHV